MEINFGNPGHGGLAASPATSGGSGQDRLPMDFYCFVKGNEIFLIFRSANSNLVTRMSPKVRNEPGWRIADGCARYILFYRNI